MVQSLEAPCSRRGQLCFSVKAPPSRSSRATSPTLESLTTALEQVFIQFAKKGDHEEFGKLSSGEDEEQEEGKEEWDDGAAGGFADVGDSDPRLKS